MPEISKQTIAQLPPPAPLAIVLMWRPEDGRTNMQWPPQMPLPLLRAVLTDCLTTIENMIAAQNGGIIKATTMPPPEQAPPIA